MNDTLDAQMSDLLALARARNLSLAAGWVEERWTGNGVQPSAKSKGFPSWLKVDEFFVCSGTRKYAVKVGYPVKVKGTGRGGAAGSGWKVVAIERSGAGAINVEVRKDRNGHTRIFKSDQIVYQRPPKGVAA